MRPNSFQQPSVYNILPLLFILKSLINKILLYAIWEQRCTKIVQAFSNWGGSIIYIKQILQQPMEMAISWKQQVGGSSA